MQRAGPAVRAVAAPKEAVLKQPRSLHSLQGLPDRDLGRGAPRRIPVAWPGRGVEASRAQEPLEDLGQERGRYGLCRSDVGERDGLTGGMRGKKRPPPQGVPASSPE